MPQPLSARSRNDADSHWRRRARLRLRELTRPAAPLGDDDARFLRDLGIRPPIHHHRCCQVSAPASVPGPLNWCTAVVGAACALSLLFGLILVVGLLAP